MNRDLVIVWFPAGGFWESVVADSRISFDFANEMLNKYKSASLRVYKAGDYDSVERGRGMMEHYFGVVKAPGNFDSALGEGLKQAPYTEYTGEEAKKILASIA